MLNNYLENVNTLPQQVEQNKEDIKVLKQYIKEAYNTNLKLEQINQSISINSTNAPKDTNSGWLIDTAGNLFQIAGNEIIAGSTQQMLILLYFCNIKGETGPQGTTGYSIRTSTDNIESTTINININTISPSTGIKVGDTIIGQNGGMGEIVSFTESLVVLSYIGQISSGGGSQLYEHNITIGSMGFRVITNSNTVFTKDTFTSWLYNNNHRNYSTRLIVSYFGNIDFQEVSSVDTWSVLGFSSSDGSKFDCHYRQVTYTLDNTTIKINESFRESFSALFNLYNLEDTVREL